MRRASAVVAALHAFSFISGCFDRSMGDSYVNASRVAGRASAEVAALHAFSLISWCPFRGMDDSIFFVV